MARIEDIRDAYMKTVLASRPGQALIDAARPARPLGKLPRPLMDPKLQTAMRQVAAVAAEEPSGTGVPLPPRYAPGPVVMKRLVAAAEGTHRQLEEANAARRRAEAEAIEARRSARRWRWATLAVTLALGTPATLAACAQLGWL